jgi:hypothetical protein
MVSGAITSGEDDLAAGRHYLVPCQVNAVHDGLPEGNAGSELAVPQPDEAPGLCLPERNEKQSGLVDVLVVGINDDDVHAAVKHAAQPVGDKRSTGAATQDDDCLAHVPSVHREAGRL